MKESQKDKLKYIHNELARCKNELSTIKKTTKDREQAFNKIGEIIALYKAKKKIKRLSPSETLGLGFLIKVHKARDNPKELNKIEKVVNEKVNTYESV